MSAARMYLYSIVGQYVKFGREYFGMIIGKDPHHSTGVSYHYMFEDGTEDVVADPAADEDFTERVGDHNCIISYSCLELHILLIYLS